MVRFVNISNEGTWLMIVIGADIHKRNHTLVAVDGQTGAARGQLAIAASDVSSWTFAVAPPWTLEVAPPRVGVGVMVDVA